MLGTSKWVSNCLSLGFELHEAEDPMQLLLAALRQSVLHRVDPAQAGRTLGFKLLVWSIFIPIKH